MNEQRDDVSRMDDLFGERLKFIRTSQGISQETLSLGMADIGHAIHVTAIGKIERGERKVSYGEALAIASLLGTPIEAFQGGNGRLKMASSFWAADKTNLREAVRDYVSALLAFAMEADKEADLGASYREWLENDMPQETPARVSRVALSYLDNRVARDLGGEAGEFVNLLRKAIVHDIDLLDEHSDSADE